MSIRRKSEKIKSTSQPNRILIGESSVVRLIVPEEVVVVLCLTVGILVLQAEGLVSAIRYLGFLFQTTPGGVFAVPQEIAVLIDHLSRDADLVAVEVVGLLAVFAVFGCPIADLRQQFVAVRIGVDIGIPAVQVYFL